MKTKYYKQLEKNVEPLHNKDWRHAFVEAGIVTEDMLVLHISANAIKIAQCDNCDKYRHLCGYVAQFKRGGFWFSRNGLHFVTQGICSDKDATYEDAQQFLKDVMEE